MPSPMGRSSMAWIFKGGDSGLVGMLRHFITSSSLKFPMPLESISAVNTKGCPKCCIITGTVNTDEKRETLGLTVCRRGPELPLALVVDWACRGHCVMR